MSEHDQAEAGARDRQADKDEIEMLRAKLEAAEQDANNGSPSNGAPTLDPSLFAQVQDRMSARASAGGGPGSVKLPRRYASFVVDHTVCVPGTFSEDFELTLCSVTARQEIEAARNAGGEGVGAVFELARMSLHAINGTALIRGKGEQETLWEWLGSGGRNLVALFMAELTGSSKEVQGKAKASLRFH